MLSFFFAKKSVKLKRLWPWMYHLSLELRQKISSERKFQRPGTQDRSRSSGNHACLGQAGAIRVTVQQLADFLVYLFEIKQLVPSTIKGYRSAIGRIISLLGGPDFGTFRKTFLT
jgi:hypothetical protein